MSQINSSHQKQTVPSREEALRLVDESNLDDLLDQASAIRDIGFGKAVSYSRKVFIPLTQLCRDVCHYCTFAQPPKENERAYMTIEEMVAIAQAGADEGCREALFTLGDKPELRYKAARNALKEMGYQTTNEYVAACAEAVLEHTSLIPHLNPGCLTEAELDMLKPLSGSMGLMVESLSANLCKKGQPHYGSPDKEPILSFNSLIMPFIRSSN